MLVKNTKILLIKIPAFGLSPHSFIASNTAAISRTRKGQATRRTAAEIFEFDLPSAASNTLFESYLRRNNTLMLDPEARCSIR